MRQKTDNDSRKPLKNQKALVTGASSGIGEACAIALAAAGASVVVNYVSRPEDAERVIADPIVRQWGTVGGSLCQADPSEDLSAAFAAVRATAVIRGPDGTREVGVREFHLGPYETVVGPGELLLELRVPIRAGAGSAYEKVERRVGDWSVAAAAAVMWLDGVQVIQPSPMLGSA